VYICILNAGRPPLAGADARRGRLTRDDRLRWVPNASYPDFPFTLSSDPEKARFRPDRVLIGSSRLSAIEMLVKCLQGLMIGRFSRIGDWVAGWPGNADFGAKRPGLGLPIWPELRPVRCGQALRPAAWRVGLAARNALGALRLRSACSGRIGRLLVWAERPAADCTRPGAQHFGRLSRPMSITSGDRRTGRNGGEIRSLSYPCPQAERYDDGLAVRRSKRTSTANGSIGLCRTANRSNRR